MTPALRLRSVTPADCWRLYALANDPEARALSFTRRPIEPEEHRAWFEQRLADPDSVIYMAADGTGGVIGYARFQKADEAVTISVALEAASRGKGLGTRLIGQAVERYRHEHGDAVIRAWVRRGNPVSQKAFQKAGFRYHSEGTVHGREAVCFIHDVSKMNENE